jgi:uncharacterized phiE125 gp8 family phage protein
MALKLITAPTAPAVTLEEAKAHLRVEGADEDALITAMVVAAEQAAEQATGRALMPQVWQLTLDAFPSALELTRVPVASVTSIKYLDATGADQTLADTEYSLGNLDDYDVARVIPAFGKSWPGARSDTNSVRVVYAAGYEDASKVPESIKAWIKLQVGAMYENREAEGAVQTYALGFADRLLDRYKVWKL